MAVRTVVRTVACERVPPPMAVAGLARVPRRPFGVTEAVALLDAEGLDGVTTRKLAARLGV